MQKDLTRQGVEIQALEGGSALSWNQQSGTPDSAVLYKLTNELPFLGINYTDRCIAIVVQIFCAFKYKYE